jgi:predicted DNA-binding ribbon-helix-helix protein
MQRKRNDVRLKEMPKFMQTLDDEIYAKLTEIAKQRGISVQELIRAVIIPDWLREKQHLKGGT